MHLHVDSDISYSPVYKLTIILHVLTSFMRFKQNVVLNVY